MYQELAASYGAALERLARAYEADADRRRDLLQDIHLALWRSCARFDGRCSSRTWVYRVAHNTATSVIVRRRVRTPTLVGLDEAERLAAAEEDAVDIVDERRALERLTFASREARGSAIEVAGWLLILATNIAVLALFRARLHRETQQYERDIHALDALSASA